MHADSGRFLVRAALSDIEQRWGQHGFVRVHRSYVANLRRAVEIRPQLGGAVDDRDGRRQRGAGRAPPGRRPAPEAADVSPSPAAAARHLPRRGLRSPREELAEATAHGSRLSARPAARQLTLSLLALVAFGAIFGVLPIALYLLPALRPHAPARRAARTVDRGRADVPRVRRDRLALRAPRRRARRRLPRAGRALIVALSRGRRRHARHARARHLGRALRAHDLGSARRLAAR